MWFFRWLDDWFMMRYIDKVYLPDKIKRERVRKLSIDQPDTTIKAPEKRYNDNGVIT